MHARRMLVAAATTFNLLVSAGCAVTLNQDSVGAYIADSAITTPVKTRFFDSSTVDANANGVQTVDQRPDYRYGDRVVVSSGHISPLS